MNGLFRGQSSGSGFRSVPVRLPLNSPLVGRVVNLEGARPLFRRVLDTLAVLRSPLLGAGVLGRWGFLFLNQFGCVSPEIGLKFCYELAGQRWIEGQIDLSSSGTGPSIDHRAYSTLTEFILLKRNVKSSFSCCISLVWKFQNVVCGFLTKESPLTLILCHLIETSSVLLTTPRGQGRGRTVIPGFAVRYISIMLPSQTRHLMCQSQTVVLPSLLPLFLHMLGGFPEKGGPLLSPLPC